MLVYYYSLIVNEPKNVYALIVALEFDRELLPD
jgi:hypothetical protein